MASTHKSRVPDMTQGAPVFFSIFSHFDPHTLGKQNFFCYNKGYTVRAVSLTVKAGGS